jgi:hypothetical protein
LAEYDPTEAKAAWPHGPIELLPASRFQLRAVEGYDGIRWLIHVEDNLDTVIASDKTTNDSCLLREWQLDGQRWRQPAHQDLDLFSRSAGVRRTQQSLRQREQKLFVLVFVIFQLRTLLLLSALGRISQLTSTCIRPKSYCLQNSRHG